VFAHQAMRSDDDIELTFGQSRQRFLDLLIGFKPVDVIDGTWETFQTLRKRTVVLHSQDGGRHQHGHLLAIGYRLECRTDGHLSFAEAYVAADEAVHRM